MASLSHNLSKPRQALLQILIAKHVMTETEVRKYRAVVVASYRVRVGLKTATFPGLVQAQAAADDIEKHLKEGSVGDLNEAFQDMNAALKVMNFEVRSMQENGSLVHTMVNLTDDELSAKHGTRMNPAATGSSRGHSSARTLAQWRSAAASSASAGAAAGWAPWRTAGR